MISIVDTHQHLWDLSRFRLPWLADYATLARDHVMADYHAEANGLAITQTVYMEVDVSPEQRPAEAEYVIDLCRRNDNPMAAAVIGGDPALPGFEDYARRFAESPHVKGIRQVLNGGLPTGYCLQPEFVRGVELLGRLGLCFDICIRPNELEDAAELASRCPEARFILDHCGNAEVPEKDLNDWKRGMKAVAARENVVCKISGIIASAPPGWTPDDLAPIVLTTAEVFGPDRIMFASDWPVCTLTASLRQWLEALKSIVSDWPESDRRKLFHDNAARFYGLELV